MRPRHVLTLLLFALGCGSTRVVDDSANSETGEDVCPELVWTDPGGGYEPLEIVSQQQAMDLPSYTRIDGSLRVWSIPGLVDLQFLACVTEVRGDVEISGNPDLETLDGLQRFTTLTPSLNENEASVVFIHNNPNLRTLEGLSGLEMVPSVLIYNNPLLESLDGLSRLRTAQRISIQRSDQLSTISLPGLESVDVLQIGEWGCSAPDVLEAAGNAMLANLDGLSSLQNYGTVQIHGNPVLTSIEGLFGAWGEANYIELNESLPYEQIVELSDGLTPISCGNLGDPQPCDCEALPP
jgi:hypothetical protein